MKMIESPCIKICRYDTNGVCYGCRRTIEEVGNWGLYSNEEKQAVIDKTRKRRNVADTSTKGFFR
ncbi:DUF1289 domain-containing protein [Prolixibacteraceae bacterium JC049]|nr:DUF1289 domain-containing protein [Prolixibacteraceae bacterium JC049]